MTDSSKMRARRMEKFVLVLETIAARLTVAEQFAESDHELLVQVDATATGIETDVEKIDRKQDEIIRLLTKHFDEQGEQNRKTNERLIELERQRKVPGAHPTAPGG